MNCVGTENTIEECGGVVELETCSGGCSHHGWLQCGSGKRYFINESIVSLYCTYIACTDGDITLVGGTTDREGRVEVCVDGRWGTVCNNNQTIAGAVCSQLGYPTEGMAIIDEQALS